MNRSRLESITNNLTGVAKKVFETVPIAEPWHMNVIAGELRRRGHNIDRKTIDGCLGSLKDSGVIRETSCGHFKRVEIHEAQPPIRLARDEPIIQTNKPEPTMTAKKQDNLAVFGVIASKLRALANEVEDAGLAMQSELAKSDAKTQKLTQLQDLLKSIGQGAE